MWSPWEIQKQTLSHGIVHTFIRQHEPQEQSVCREIDIYFNEMAMHYTLRGRGSSRRKWENMGQRAKRGAGCGSEGKGVWGADTGGIWRTCTNNSKSSKVMIYLAARGTLRNGGSGEARQDAAQRRRFMIMRVYLLRVCAKQAPRGFPQVLLDEHV